MLSLALQRCVRGPVFGAVICTLKGYSYLLAAGNGDLAAYAQLSLFTSLELPSTAEQGPSLYSEGYNMTFFGNHIFWWLYSIRTKQGIIFLWMVSCSVLIRFLDANICLPYRAVLWPSKRSYTQMGATLLEVERWPKIISGLHQRDQTVYQNSIQYMHIYCKILMGGGERVCIKEMYVFKGRNTRCVTAHLWYNWEPYSDAALVFFNR